MNARLDVPARARRGEEFPVRLVLQHPMENGLRRGDDGRLVPYSVVERLVVRYNGAEALAVDLSPGIAANPYLSFQLVAEASGEVAVEWATNHGEKGVVRAAVLVEPA